MKLSLEVMTDGKQKGKLLPINLPQFVIGRDPQCQLRPASPSISKRHCAILLRDGRAYVRDFDSTNGTFVNECQLKGEVELNEGDNLRIGPIMFIVRIETNAPVNKLTPPPTKGNQTTPEVKQPPAEDLGKPKKKGPPAAQVQKKTGQTSGNETLSGSDDDVGDMLLSMGDDGSSSGAFDGVPEGSTVMDVPLPPGALDPAAANKDKEKPKVSANTQNAAKDILDKYMKRPR